MRKVLLTAALLAPVLLQQAAAQNRQISGRVTDRATGQGLPGVTVLVKGTTVGVSTNADGTYTISAPASATALTFSSIGFVGVERPIGTASTIDIGLSTDSKQLGEVVVTGALGIERQEKSLTYSVAVLDSKSLTQGHETNPVAALQGKVAGVNIGKSSGGVNSSTRITLRGQRSLLGENQPLFVIDGIPIDNSNVQPSNSSANLVDVGNRVGDINPEDIETLTVLKGPSAAALYGSRASNGAIIITTKTGRDAAIRGKGAEITYTSSFTAERPLKLPDLQNKFGSGYDLETYVPFENTNYGPRFDGSPVVLGPPAVDGSVQIVPYSAQPNNVKDFFNTGTTFQNTVSLQGGDAKTNFYLSFSDAVQKGIIPEDRFRRNTLKLSAATRLANKVTASTSINYNHNKTDVTFVGSDNGSVTNNVYNTSRQVNLQNYKDVYNNPFATRDGYFSGYYDNPYQSIKDNRFNSNLDRVLGNVTLNYKPVDWVGVTYRVGSDVSFDRRTEINAKKTYQRRSYPNDKTQFPDYAGQGIDRPSNFAGRLAESTLYIQTTNSDLLFTFNRNVTPDLTAQLIVGNNVRLDNRRYTDAVANALSIPGFYNLSNKVGEISGGDLTGGRGTFESQKRIVGVYGDLALSFREFLFLNATARNDWSSTLPKDNRSYFYYSAGVGLLFSDAVPVLKDSNILSYGKLSASYAQVGNDTDPYQLVNPFPSAAGFPYGALPGFTVSNSARNPALKPESTNSYEAGVETAWLNDRLGANLTYYQTRTTNQIVSLSVPSSTGFTSAVLNVGEVKNSGIELALRATPIRTEGGFRFDIGFNFNNNKSEVLSLTGDVNELALGGGNPVPTVIVGQPFPVLKGSAFLRDPEGNIVVSPTTGYPLRDPNLKNLGQVNPKYVYGGNISLSYKGVNLTAVVDARTGGVIYSGTKSTLAFTGSSEETAANDRLPYVIPGSVVQNSDGSYSPNTTPTRDGGFELFYSNLSNPVAEYNTISSDYFKLREVALTYTLPKAWLGNSPFGRASLGVSGRNLLLFVPSENKFIDPEANAFGTGSSQGREFNTIPSTRSLGANLTVTF